MKYLLPLLSLSLLFSQELEVEGNLKVQGEILFQDESSLSTGAIVPIGVMMPFAGSEAPDGWLLCYGQEVSREEYAILFGVIGNTYGDGDGSTTFALPDLRGRTTIGLDKMGGNSADRVVNAVADTLGGGSGEEMHQLTVDEMPSHNHSISGATNTSGSPMNITMMAIGINQTKSTNETGGNQLHNNMPPYLAINYIIKY